MVSLKNIAERVGVSSMAVSLALRDDPAISTARRQQIQRIAKEMGYVPNPLARGLRGQKTNSVALLWSLGGAPGNTMLVRDLTNRIQSHGYVPYMMDHLSEANRAMAMLDSIAQRRVDGVVLQAGGALTHDRELMAKLERFPAVLVVTDRPLDDASFDVIVHDRSSVFHEIADYLIATGRKHPRMLVGAKGSEQSGNGLKRRAFREALALRGVVVDEPLDVHHCNGPQPCAEDYWRALETLGRSSLPFDALVCGTDEGAVVACGWLRAHGYRIPEDVAVVGFNNVRDDLPYLDPPLASVARRDDELAKSIEDLLVARLQAPQRPPQMQEVRAHFVWRASAGGCDPHAVEQAGTPSTGHAEQIESAG